MNISGNYSFDFNINCSYTFVAWTLAYVLLSPVFIFVLCIGFTRCRRTRSRSSTTTHSDVFTFNMAAVEVVGILGYCFNLLFTYIWDHLPNVGGESMNIVTLNGQTLFHILVCLERYLAVVHPITYLRLKKNGEVIRNASIAVVWLFSAVMACVYQFQNTFVDLLNVVISGILSQVLVTFFCASVLYVLIRPGPGERGGNRRHVDQSKRRAFHTVAAITVALMLKFGTLFFMYMAHFFQGLSESQLCLFYVSVQWFYIPSSLVMPVLFLSRRAKQRKKAQMTTAMFSGTQEIAL